MKKRWINPELLQLNKSVNNALSNDSVDTKNSTTGGLVSTRKSFAAVMSRKAKRRYNKKLKKIKKVAFASKKSLQEVLQSHDVSERINVDDRRGAKQAAKRKKAQHSRSSETSSQKQPIKKAKHQLDSISAEYKKHQRQVDAERRKQQRVLTREEDRSVEMYAKKLGLNKRKSQAMPKSFEADGLGYLLELCGSLGEEDKLDEEGDMDVSDKIRTKGGADDDNDDVSANELEDEGDDMNDVTAPGSSGQMQDIYGRIGGNPVKGEESVATAAKAIAQDEDDISSADYERLSKIVKGLINRLSESNMQSISGQIQELFSTHSRHSMKRVLCDTIFKACLKDHRLPDRLMMEHAMLIAILYSSIGVDVGAYILESLCKEFFRLYDQCLTDGASDSNDFDRSKAIDNTLLLLCGLYDLKLFHSGLIVDVLKYLADRFTVISVELILLLVENAGFRLRKDDPVGLKEVISLVHSNASSMTSEQDKHGYGARTRFMLETLSAVKNNNVTKVTGYDPQLQQHFSKLLRILLKGTAEHALRVALDDLLNADRVGRWWIVGSSFSSQAPRALMESGSGDKLSFTPNSTPSALSFSSELIELARQQRMNTDLRITIFCIIMSAEDYIDAFSKIQKLSLKGAQEREIIHICVDCCTQEADFNPYYGYLNNQFCANDKKFKLTTQFAIWDKLKQLSHLGAVERRNIAQLIAQLIRMGAVGLVILKFYNDQFAMLDKRAERLIKTVLKELIRNCHADEVKSIFEKIGRQQQLIDGLSYYVSHHWPNAVLTGTASSDRSGDIGQKNGPVAQKMNQIAKLLYLMRSSR